MTSTPWTAALAGSLGLGRSGVRVGGHFSGGTVVEMAAAAAATAATAADGRLRPACARLVPAQTQPRIAPTHTALNDGTTLGISPSRRPQS
jgi:hypothetical protein